MDINDTYSDAFPYSYRHTEKEQVVLTDVQGNIYIIKDGLGLTVEKKHQTSPSDTKKKTGEGDFITAYIDHGTSPKEASYEYMMLVKPSGKESGKFAKKLPYSVLQADNSAHVVKDNITGITAYISYKGYSSASTVAAEIPAETIVMERKKEDGMVVMSICTPDLGIVKKGYTTSERSNVIVKEVLLDGKYSLAQENGAVSLEDKDGRTLVRANCVDGRPVEFLIKK